MRLENTPCDHLFLLRARGFMVIGRIYMYFFFLFRKWQMVLTYFFATSQ